MNDLLSECLQRGEQMKRLSQKALRKACLVSTLVLLGFGILFWLTWMSVEARNWFLVALCSVCSLFISFIGCFFVKDQLHDATYFNNQFLYWKKRSARYE